MKAQLDELTTEIKLQLKVATGQIEEVTKHLGVMERSLAGREKWNNGGKDTLIQPLNNQKQFRAKTINLEGHSQHNNTATYNIPVCRGLLHATICGTPNTVRTGWDYG